MVKSQLHLFPIGSSEVDRAIVLNLGAASLCSDSRDDAATLPIVLRPSFDRRKDLFSVRKIPLASLLCLLLLVALPMTLSHIGKVALSVLPIIGALSFVDALLIPLASFGFFLASLIIAARLAKRTAAHSALIVVSVGASCVAAKVRKGFCFEAFGTRFHAFILPQEQPCL